CCSAYLSLVAAVARPCLAPLGWTPWPGCAPRAVLRCSSASRICRACQEAVSPLRTTRSRSRQRRFSVDACRRRLRRLSGVLRTVPSGAESRLRAPVASSPLGLIPLVQLLPGVPHAVLSNSPIGGRDPG